VAEDGGEAFLRHEIKGKKMEKETVRLNVDLAIHHGQLEAFESLAQSMTAISQTEAGTLAYEWYFSADRTRCRLIEIYTDANAVLAHFMGAAVQEFVPKLMTTASVSRFEVYGDPGPKVKEMIAGLGAEIFSFRRGLGR
jgi:quinol monooxygenase YgiN